MIRFRASIPWILAALLPGSNRRQTSGARLGACPERLSPALTAARRRDTASSVAPICPHIGRSLRPCLACLSPPDHGSAFPDRPLVACEDGARPESLVLAYAVAPTVEARLLAYSVIALGTLPERRDPASLHSLSLTRREREVLVLVAKGRTNKEIAARMHVRATTVNKHLERIYENLGVRTRTAAAAAAFRAAESETRPSCRDGSRSALRR